MDNNKLTNKLLSNTNFPLLKDATSFVTTYIEKLVYDVVTYVDTEITIGKIEILDSYQGKVELSQGITGVPSAYSAIDGATNALVEFAEQYSHLGIKKFDDLAKEVLVDFLNLHNGLFVVQLSKNNICELSLDVPKQNGNYAFDHSSYKSITVIPIMFSFGTVKFLLCEI